MSETMPEIPASIRVQSRANRPVFTYPIPEDARATVGIDSIGMVALTFDEEMQVMALMKGSNTGAAVKVQYELAKKSLQEVNGQALPLVGEARDRAWSDMTPQARTLVLRAYNDIHTLEKDVEKDFLKGKTITLK